MTRSRPTARGPCGFTLLETLVTLVVVSLIVVVLMQALQQSLGLRTRLLRFEREARTSVLQEAWFRDTVRAAIADTPEAMGAMAGTPHAVSFVSSAPLTGEGLSRIEWTLRPVDGGFALEYAESGGTPLTILPGPLGDAAFSFLDEQGNWRQEWTYVPPDPRRAVRASEEVPEDSEALPRLVRLRADTHAGELSWLVPVIAPPRPPERMSAEDYGVGL